MKPIVCELCGSNQLIKKDGFFQCEYCGTKYTLEEARKLIGKVEIEGEVSVKSADFTIRAGVLERYNGEDVNVVIPDSVTVIGAESFKNCYGLTNVTIPKGVTRIEKSAFSGCRNLTGVVIPDSVKEIGDFAFGDCVGLKSVILPESVTEIWYSAFDGCDNITELSVSERFMTSLYNNVFNKTAMIIQRRRSLVCQYCGGQFKGVFNKVCSICDRPKDYSVINLYGE